MLYENHFFTLLLQIVTQCNFQHCFDIPMRFYPYFLIRDCSEQIGFLYLLTKYWLQALV